MTDQIFAVSKHEHSRFFFFFPPLMLMFESTMRIKASVRIQFNSIICNRAISTLFNLNIRWRKKDFASYMGLVFFAFVRSQIRQRSKHPFISRRINCQKSIFTIQSTTGFFFIFIFVNYLGLLFLRQFKSWIYQSHHSDSHFYSSFSLNSVLIIADI